MNDGPIPSGPRQIFPPHFGRRFILFADAEEEFDWTAPFDRQATRTSAIEALPEATRRFNDAGMQPVYLCDYPVVTNTQSAAIIAAMAAQGACVIGSQLHPWVTPPHEEGVGPHNSYLCNLPLDLQRAKIQQLTEVITKLVGASPRVFRAGRYGLSAATAKLLADLGYHMDVSVRALFNYRSHGGPDFSGHPVYPWRVGRLAEVPLTSVWTGFLRHTPGLYKLSSARGALAKLGMLARVPLTPEGVLASEALEAIAILDGEGHDLFSLSFHTPSLVPDSRPMFGRQMTFRLFGVGGMLS